MKNPLQRGLLFSQPLSVKSKTASQLRDFQRSASAIRTGKERLYNLRHGVSQGRLGRPVLDRSRKSRLNVTEAGSHVVRSGSTSKLVRVPPQREHTFLAYMADVIKPYLGKGRQRPSWNGEATQVLGKNRKGRNVMAHSQYVKISKILKEPTGRRNVGRTGVPAATTTKAKSGKEVKAEGIEEMHMGLVAHYQKIKRMLRRVEVPDSLSTEDANLDPRVEPNSKLNTKQKQESQPRNVEKTTGPIDTND